MKFFANSTKSHRELVVEPPINNNNLDERQAFPTRDSILSSEDRALAIMKAVNQNNLVEVQALIAMGGDPISPKHRGMIIETAVYRSSLPMLRALINMGGDPISPEYRGAAIEAAAYRSNLPMVLDLINMERDSLRDENIDNALWKVTGMNYNRGIILALSELGTNSSISQKRKDVIACVSARGDRELANLLRDENNFILK